MAAKGKMLGWPVAWRWPLLFFLAAVAVPLTVRANLPRLIYNSGSSLLATETRQFDRRGNLISFTDANGNVVTSFYDGLDRLKQSIGPGATATSDQQTTT